MTSNDVVVAVVNALESQNIPYMLVGSYSSNAFGIARSTQDADFVIEATDRPLGPVFQALAPVLRFDPQMLLETVTMTSRYVGVHPASGFKVELFLVTDDAHDRERFKRRAKLPFLDIAAFLPTPEDVLIQKLRWYKRGRRHKDLEDARNVTAVQFGKLDLPYIRHWVDAHNSREIFEQILTEAAQFGE